MFGIENSANNFGRSAGLLSNLYTEIPIRAALGTLFIASDTLIVYRWNGTAWDLIGGGGGVFGGATNGLQVIGSNVGLGGSLTQNTDINCFNYNFKFEVFNSFAIGDGTEPTMIWNSSTETIITSFGGGNIGLNLDFNNNIYKFGDFDIASSGTSLEINDATSVIITKYGGGTKGLNLDFASNEYILGNTFNNSSNIGIFGTTIQTQTNSGYNDGLKIIEQMVFLGDYDTINNSTFLLINDITQNIITTNGGNDRGLNLDFVNNQYYLGDFFSNVNGTTFLVDDNSQLISTRNGGVNKGLKLDFTGGQYYLGDYDNLTNQYWLRIDDVAGQLDLNGANLISGSASGSSGQHLVIVLNGNTYKIKLENP